jgi:diguanylate cyclase
MERPTQPGDIAREAIRRLASRRQPPTPENFSRAYAEVEGREPALADWPNTLRALIKQWDGYQPGLTRARKQEMLERVIINFGSNPDQLAIKIANLAKSWGESAGAAEAAELGSPRISAPDGVAAAPQAEPCERAVDLTLPLAEGLEQMAVGLQERWPDLAERARELAGHFAGDAAAAEDAITRMTALWREILVRAEDDHELLCGFQRLLEALFSNMSSLVVDDAWLQGQLHTIGVLLRERLNYHVLHEAERSLQEVIARQGQVRDSLQAAKHKLKQLISTFIDRVGELSSSTGEYHDRLQDYSERISRAEDIHELAAVIDSLNADMGSMREAMRRTHAELVQARSQVEEADRRIQSLERELEEASAMIREDQLTGALNRRGMEEAFARELSRAARLSAPLAVALLDIDHFKRLNDSLGHQAGDRALVHLAQVVRQLLRPTDALARYGGEEFLILLPNTELEEAVKVMQRVQRELTRQFFMHENQRVLITFSAGVVQLAPGEDREAVIARADAAMYRAKTGGRNRVERG